MACSLSVVKICFTVLSAKSCIVQMGEMLQVLEWRTHADNTIQGENKFFPWLQTFITRKLRGIIHSFIHPFIHSAFCLTTGPKPPPKRCLHIVRSRASSFKWEYPLLSYIYIYIQVVYCCMWCSALGVVAVVLRSRCVVVCTVCELVSGYKLRHSAQDHSHNT